jgi:hypothetical protein
MTKRESSRLIVGFVAVGFGAGAITFTHDKYDAMIGLGVFLLGLFLWLSVTAAILWRGMTKRGRRTEDEVDQK